MTDNKDGSKHNCGEETDDGKKWTINIVIFLKYLCFFFFFPQAIYTLGVMGVNEDS